MYKPPVSRVSFERDLLYIAIGRNITYAFFKNLLENTSLTSQIYEGQCLCKTEKVSDYL